MAENITQINGTFKYKDENGNVYELCPNMSEENKESIINLVSENCTLGVHTDGLVYLFVNEKPVGNGVKFIQNTGDVVGYVDSDNNIILTGNIAEGETYTFKFAMESGTEITIGEATLVEESDEPVRANYTNLFDPSKATINNRASLSSGFSSVDGAVVSDFIDISDKTPFTEDIKLYVENATFNPVVSGENNPQVIFFKTKPSSGFSNSYSCVRSNELVSTDEGNGVTSISVGAVHGDSGVQYMVLVLKVKDTAITTEDVQNIVVTFNEPIYL